MDNPFIIERAVKGRHLVDRLAEVEKVKSTIKRGGKLFVIGPRRYGKTSILHAAVAQLQAEDCKVISLNVEGYTSLELLIRTILSGAAGFAGNLKQATTSLKKFFAQLNPSLTFNPLEGSFDASLGLKATEPEQQGPLLIEALNSLEQWATHSRQKIGLVLDEFQHLLTLGGPGIEGQLRAAVQLHEHVGYVFAGSQMSLLTDMISNPARPFYRLGEPLFIGEVPWPDFRDYLQQGFAQLDCDADEESLSYLFQLAEGVPYHVQLLASNCWDEVSRNPKPTLSRADVEAALQQLIRLFDPYHASLWAGLTAYQQRALRMIATDVTQGLTGRQSLKQADLTAGTMRKSLQALEQRNLIRKEYVQATQRYRFEDPFFKQWILTTIKG
jgi:hypothetical protein